MEEEGRFDFAARLLEEARRKGADSAEAWFAHGWSRRVGWRDRSPETAELAESGGFALRVAAGGRQGFAYLSAGKAAEAARAAEEAMASARLGDEPAVPFAGPGVPPPPPEGLDDPSFGEGPGAAREELAMAQIERAFAASPRVRRLRRLAISERRFVSGLLTSAGFRASKGGTLYTMSASVVAGEGGDNEEADEWAWSRRFEGLAGEDPAGEAARRADRLLGGRPVPTGRYPVVLAPPVAAVFVSVLASALSGETVAKGKSPLAGRLGEEVASPAFDLVDDGLMPGGWGSEPFDDEGVPRRRVALLRAGRLEEYLLSRKAAALLSREPTGHGSRGDYRSLPSPGAANLFVSPTSPRPVSELLGMAEGGLLVVDVLGAHTLDAVGGGVSLGASGFVVRGGEPDGPFRGVTLAGNLYEMLKRVEAAGDDLRFLGPTGSPSLLIGEMDVSGG